MKTAGGAGGSTTGAARATRATRRRSVARGRSTGRLPGDDSGNLSGVAVEVVPSHQIRLHGQHCNIPIGQVRDASLRESSL